jgi:hypothetical protein
VPPLCALAVALLGVLGGDWGDAHGQTGPPITTIPDPSQPDVVTPAPRLVPTVEAGIPTLTPPPTEERNVSLSTFTASPVTPGTVVPQGTLVGSPAATPVRSPTATATAQSASDPPLGRVGGVLAAAAVLAIVAGGAAVWWLRR